MNKPPKNPFGKERAAGCRLLFLHHIGACAVALVSPPPGPNAAPYYAVAFHRHRARTDTRAGVPGALAELRRLDNAHLRREDERLTLADFVACLPEHPPEKLSGAFRYYGLAPNAPTPRQLIRRAITTKRGPGVKKWLALLDMVSPSQQTAVK